MNSIIFVKTVFLNKVTFTGVNEFCWYSFGFSILLGLLAGLKDGGVVYFVFKVKENCFIDYRSI